MKKEKTLSKSKETIFSDLSANCPWQKEIYSSIAIDDDDNLIKHCGCGGQCTIENCAPYYLIRGINGNV